MRMDGLRNRWLPTPKEASLRTEKFCWAAIIVLLLSQAIGQAQSTNGTISGTVKDATGAVLPGTKVVLLNQETGISRTVQADAAGHYSAPSLSLGNYQVTGSLEGFQTEVRKGIVLTVGRQAIVNFELAVGAVTETVEVTGEAPLVETTSSSLGALVDDRTIRDLPLNGRSYEQLALLQPGVIKLGGGTTKDPMQYGSGARFSVAGGRSDTNSFLMDGTDIVGATNSVSGGASGMNMGVDTIREFKILTNSFAAEYGRSAGAIITAVTRSGTNSLHGSGFEFLRNSRLDARNFFDPGKTPPFRRNQFGGTVGGPIRRDKTFFFGGYEGLREGLATTGSAFVPSLNVRRGILPSQTVTVDPKVAPFLNLYPPPNGRDFGDGTAEFLSAPLVVTRDYSFMGRVDHQLNESTSIFGRYQFDDDGLTIPGNIPTFESLNAGRRQYATIQANSVLSPTVLNHFHFAFNRTIANEDTLPTEALGPQFSFVPGLPMGLVQIGAAEGIGATRSISNLGTSGTVPRDVHYNLWEWADDVSYIKGSHSLKTGLNIKRMQANMCMNTNLRGVYTFPTLDRLVTNQASQLAVVGVGQDACRGYRQTFGAAYVQDDFSVTPRLTLNLGFRWEAVTDPTEANGRVSNIIRPTDPELTILGSFFKVGKKNFEPRVGFAWRLNESGTTVLRVGGGIFHNHTLPSAYAVNVSKLPPFFTNLIALNPAFPDGVGAARAGGAAPALFTMAVNQKELAKYQHNLSIQQELGNNTVVELAYAGAKTDHIIRFTEQNSPIPTILPDGRKCFNFISGGNQNPLCPNGATARHNRNFANIRIQSSDTNAFYSSFTVTLRRQISSGFRYQAFYTWSRATDTISGVATGDERRSAATSLDADDWKRDWGLSSFDARHNFVFNLNYPLPLQFDSKALRAVLGGWEVSSIGTFTSGQPFTVRLGGNASRNQDALAPDRPDLKPGANNNPVLGGADRYFDPTVFSLPAPGTYGNVGRNTIIGPGVANLDLSLIKSFPFREGGAVQFRAEFFNIFNHANFGLPAPVALEISGAIRGSAGRIIDTVTASRQIQFGLKISF